MKEDQSNGDSQAAERTRISNFVDALIEHASGLGVRVQLDPADRIDIDGTLGSGYFDPNEMAIKVAAGQDLGIWVPVLIHEVCHATQINQNTEANERFYTNEPTSLIDAHLAGERVGQRRLRRAVLDLIDYEREAEAMTVEVLVKNDLDGAIINVAEYARLANVYLAYHHIVTRVGWDQYPSRTKILPVLDRFPAQIGPSDYYRRARFNRLLMQSIDPAGIIQSPCSIRSNS